MNTDDEDHEVPDFGWWPEIFGAVAVIAVIGCLIAFARGSL